MKLPNANHAVVDIEKLEDYCLSMSHPRGRHKARVFASVFGITANESDVLRAALLTAARSEEVRVAEEDEFGKRFVVDFSMEHRDKQAMIRSSWIVRAGEDFPRLTSCYVL